MQLQGTFPAIAIWSWVTPVLSLLRPSRGARALRALRGCAASSNTLAVRCASTGYSRRTLRAGLPANAGTLHLRDHPSCDSPCGKDRRRAADLYPGRGRDPRDLEERSQVWRSPAVFPALPSTEWCLKSDIHDTCFSSVFI